jgi:prophage regulatory protein
MTGASEIRLIDIRAVSEIVGCRKTKLYEMVRAGTFPAPCHAGKSSRWVLGEVENYVLGRIAERNARLGVTTGPQVLT